MNFDEIDNDSKSEIIPFFNDYDRELLRRGKYTYWAKDIDKNTLLTLLWMVGEYGIRTSDDSPSEVGRYRPWYKFDQDAYNGNDGKGSQQISRKDSALKLILSIFRGHCCNLWKIEPGNFAQVGRLRDEELEKQEALQKELAAKEAQKVIAERKVILLAEPIITENFRLKGIPAFERYAQVPWPGKESKRLILANYIIKKFSDRIEPFDFYRELSEFIYAYDISQVVQFFEDSGYVKKERYEHGRHFFVVLPKFNC